MTYTSIDDLVDEWGRLIFLGTHFVQIMKIGANTFGALVFHDGNRVGNPRRIGNGVDKLDFVKLVNFLLYFFCLIWCS